MRRILAAIVVAAFIAVPAALADASPRAPGAFCVAHKALIGPGLTYPTMRACVAGQKAQNDKNVVNAATACIAERDDANFASAHGGKTFDQFYGANANGKGKGDGNAFGKCVSSRSSGKTAEQQTTLLNAAKTCRTPEMRALIGAGKQYKNFGACVSAQVKQATS